MYRAIAKLQVYFSRCLFLPETFSEELLAEVSYSRWAAYEIIERFLQELEKPTYSMKEPYEIITEFILELDRYVELGTHLEIWDTARQTASDIRHIFRKDV